MNEMRAMCALIKTNNVMYLHLMTATEKNEVEMSRKGYF